ncbi:MAG TPA: hypothetical protein VIH42_14635 [Thermoguttaceae bacterium]
MREERRQQEQIKLIRQELGRHIVVVFRKGGRIKEERRYDSESDSFEEVFGVKRAIGSLIHNTPIGIDLIGEGWVGVLPWERPISGKIPTEVEIFNANCPVRVADVVENNQTGITTIYLESV